ncbi:MAG: alpha-2-macroglobulin, partial [Flavobacteriales bacterium]|nr:alpha-2-macroglobulin [Flavobacteriales bacterium]
FRAGMDHSQFPTETHALLIEAFNEIAQDERSVNGLRTHLLQLKRTTHWSTTAATTEAVYALLLGGPDLLVPSDPPSVLVGGVPVPVDTLEAGTGYFSYSWPAEEIGPGMGQVRLTTPGDRLSWGALHWQYFQELDKVTSQGGPFQIGKEVMRKVVGDHGAELVPVVAGGQLRVGDEVVLRITLTTDRWLDHVHVKDLRASAMEPIDHLSGIRVKGRLVYYQSIKDASMHFFFDRLAPGTHLLEYALRVTHEGAFQNGVASATCMYAPEFAAHSPGVKLVIE